MSIFCYKKLEKSVRLSDKLKQKREELGLDLQELVLRTHIPLKYLEAIEQEKYCFLPKAKVYRRAYIREYAKAIGLKDKDCVQQFSCEEGLNGTPQVHPLRKIKLFPFASLSIFFRNSVFIGAVVLFSGYLIWQINGILQPPKLIVYSPMEGYTISQSTILVQGETEKETQLTVNGQAVMANEAGKFETKIDLAAGVNTITITAKKKTRQDYDHNAASGGANK